MKKKILIPIIMLAGLLVLSLGIASYRYLGRNSTDNSPTVTADSFPSPSSSGGGGTTCDYQDLQTSAAQTITTEADKLEKKYVMYANNASSSLPITISTAANQGMTADLLAQTLYKYGAVKKTVSGSYYLDYARANEALTSILNSKTSALTSSVDDLYPQYKTAAIGFKDAVVSGVGSLTLLDKHRSYIAASGLLTHQYGFGSTGGSYFSSDAGLNLLNTEGFGVDHSGTLMLGFQNYGVNMTGGPIKCGYADTSVSLSGTFLPQANGSLSFTTKPEVLNDKLINKLASILGLNPSELQKLSGVVQNVSNALRSQRVYVSIDKFSKVYVDWKGGGYSLGVKFAVR